jgi:hypothetical protein
MTEVHVIPDDRNTWRVYDAREAKPVSQHTNATDAELAAVARATDRDEARIVVHDRYHRTHDVAASPSGAAVRRRRHRVRWLGRARELARAPG